MIKSQKQIDDFIKIPESEIIKLNKNKEIESKVEIPFISEYKDKNIESIKPFISLNDLQSAKKQNLTIIENTP